MLQIAEICVIINVYKFTLYNRRQILPYANVRKTTRRFHKKGRRWEQWSRIKQQNITRTTLPESGCGTDPSKGVAANRSGTGDVKKHYAASRSAYRSKSRCKGFVKNNQTKACWTRERHSEWWRTSGARTGSSVTLAAFWRQGAL